MDNCSGSVLDPNDVCPIAIRYRPSLVFFAATTISAQIQIVDNAHDSPQVVDLIGGSAVAGAADILPEEVDFGPVDINAKGKPFTITFVNNGKSPLAIKTADIVGDNPKDFVLNGDGCRGRTLATNESCTISVFFFPQKLGGKVASLVIFHNGKDGQTVISLKGIGVETVGLRNDQTLPSRLF